MDFGIASTILELLSALVVAEILDADTQTAHAAAITAGAGLRETGAGVATAAPVSIRPR